MIRSPRICLLFLSAGLFVMPFTSALADDHGEAADAATAADTQEAPDDAADSGADVAQTATEEAAESVDSTIRTGDAAESEEAETSEAAPPVDDGFANDTERLSYAIGLDIGGSFRSQGIEITPSLMGEAIAAAYTEGEPRMTEDQAISVLRNFQARMQQKMIEEQRQAQQTMADDNIKAGEAFFAENKDKEGVKVTESGLQYLVNEMGDGATAGPTDLVTVHYRGTLIDGTVFDSSYDRGEPATFQANGVIPGFSEGLQLMPVGSQGVLYIPGELAYGMNPPPRSPITPMSPLIFEVEILAVEAAAAAEEEELPPLAD
ncbi:MAG: FKBP-type peptidyl-prolyl cis-trans isomerase [Planctomycetota bacterium]